MTSKATRIMERVDKLKAEGKIIPATFEPMFKQVMISCPNYLSLLISEILKIDKRFVRENLRYKNNELGISKIVEKGKISDVLVEVGKNIINLEMNEKYYDGLFEKNDNYLKRIGTQKILVGEKYDMNRKIIQINFDDFEYFDERMIIKFQLMDQERGLIEIESYEKYHVNLKAINKRKVTEKGLSILERALMILTCEKVDDLMELGKGEKELMEASKKIDELTSDVEMIGLYDIEEDRKLVEKLKRDYDEKIFAERMKALEEQMKEREKTLEEKMKEREKTLEEEMKEKRKTLEEEMKEREKALEEKKRILEKEIKERESDTEGTRKSLEKEITKNIVVRLLKENIPLETIVKISNINREQLEKLVLE